MSWWQVLAVFVLGMTAGIVGTVGLLWWFLIRNMRMWW